MRGCTVYANDINPESVKWMQINLQTNQSKKSPKEYHVYNLDGREFLRTIVFPHIEIYQRTNMLKNKIVILMNLPEIGLTFLDVFSEWLLRTKIEQEQWKTSIHIYCYTFSRGDNHFEDIRVRLKTIWSEIEIEEKACRFVRQVAPNKDMMCVNICLFDKIE